MIDFDHDGRDELTLTRRAAPLALEKFLEILLGLEAGDRIEGTAPEQVVFDQSQFLVGLVQGRPERLLAVPPVSHTEQEPGTDQKQAEERKGIDHSPGLF